MSRVLFFLYGAVLVFAPLSFGASEPWSMAIVQLLVACGCLWFIWAAGASADLRRVPGLVPLCLLVCWMFIQIIPLPPGLVRIVAPSVHDVYQPILDVAGRDLWLPLSVNRKATLFEGLRIATCALFYFLTVQFLQDGRRLRKIVSLVAWLAVAIAFLAVIQKFSSPDKIYWFRQVPANAAPVGPWVYHNHYAGFMEMTLPLVLALCLFYRPVADKGRGWRQKLVALFSTPGMNLYFFLGFGVILMFSSVFISLSRGGLVSLCLALLLFMVLLPGRVIRKKYFLYGSLAVSIILMVTWFGWGPVATKFGSVFGENGTIRDLRLMLWGDSLRIIRDFFLTGTGFGTFIHIYPLYASRVTGFILDHAHNDYLELFTDGGVIGFVLAAWFVLAVLYHGRQRMCLRRDRFAVLLSLGALTGIVSILLHGMTDFNMHNGANTLYFFFLCGLLVSAANTRLYYRTRPTLLEPAAPAAAKGAAGAALLLLVAVVIVRGGALYADRLYAPVANTYLNRNLRQAKVLRVAETAALAGRYDPLEGRYSFAQGSALVFLGRPADAFDSFLEAGRKDPLAGTYLQRLALMLASRDGQEAERLLAIAYDRALNKEYLILTWAEWLLSRNERDKATSMLRRVFRENPEALRRFMPVLAAYSFSRSEMMAVLPDSVSAWARYGALLEQQGKMEDAAYFRSHALDFLDREKVVKPWYFSQLYKFYLRRQEKDKALDLLQEATRRLPDYPKFHILLGDYYREEGIVYRAREEYEQALLLDPANMELRRKLEEMGAVL